MNILIIIVLLFVHSFVSTDIQPLKNYARNSINYYLILTRQIPSKANESLKNIKGRFDWISLEEIGNSILADITYDVFKVLLALLGFHKIMKRCVKKETEKYFKNKSPPVGNTYNNCHFEYSGCDRYCEKCKTTRGTSYLRPTKINKVPHPKHIIVIYKRKMISDQGNKKYF
ncbi:MAG: hypothetical protein KAQ87_05305 [Candidatus Pacebacteria bacterium]|nr:hypothetical protein [Candidatus Paceibacterota bacterium]